MPYQIGGVNIRTLAETAAASDPREGTGFSSSKYLYEGSTHQDHFGQKMITNHSGYMYSNECGIGSRFLRNGSAYFSVAAKGCRPCPTYARRRWDSSAAGTYYVNRFSDGEVWVSTTFNSRTGTRISTASDNMQYIFVILIGPGGGGGGGNGTKAGGGGGGGSFAYLCHRLVAGRVHRIYIGGGGSGGARNTNGGGSGNCQFATFTDINNLGASGVTTVNAIGGGGGQSGKREIDAEQYNTQSREIMEQLDELFKQRDELIAEQSDSALSKSQYKILTDFLKNEQKQTEFEKDVFTKLIEKIIVNSREDITFIFKDGTEVKAF